MRIIKIASRFSLIFSFLIAFQAFAWGSEVSVKISAISGTKSGASVTTPSRRAFQVILSRERAEIPWSFSETSAEDVPATLKVAQVVEENAPLQSGFRFWSNGFHFQAAQLNFLVSWDGTVYLKNEGQVIHHSLSLQTSGKVVLLDGSFQQKLKIKSASIEFPKYLNLENFLWQPKNNSVTPEVRIEKDTKIEAKSFVIRGKLMNQGSLLFRDQGKLISDSLDNYKMIQGMNLEMRIGEVKNRSEIRTDGKLILKSKKIENFKGCTIFSRGELDLEKGIEIVNSGWITSESKTKLEVNKLLNENGFFRVREQLSLTLNGPFENEGGHIQAGSVELNLQGVSQIKNLGIIEATGKVPSSDFVIRVANGFFVERGELKSTHRVFVEARDQRVEWKNVQVRAEAFSIEGTNFHVNDQESPRNFMILYRGPLKIQNSIHTKSHLCIWPIYGSQEQSPTIEILSDIVAKGGITIRGPQAKLRIGDHRAEKPVEIQGEIFQAEVGSFDLENGVIASVRGSIHAPQGIKIGKLVTDPIRESFTTVYAHSQSPYSHNLGGNISSPTYQFLAQTLNQSLYDGHHLFTLPLAVSNPSSFVAKESLTLIGPLQNYGRIRSQDFTLDSTKDSVAEASKIEVERNLILKGGGSLSFKRHIGDLSFSYATYGNGVHWGRGKYLFAASDPAELWVGGKLTADPRTKIFNHASRVYIHEKDPNLMIDQQDFAAGLYQKFVSGTFEERRSLNALVPSMPSNWMWIHRHFPGLSTHTNPIEFTADNVRQAKSFLHRTNNFAGAQKVFPAETSFSSKVVIPADRTQLQGRLAAPQMLIPVQGGGVAIGSPNPYYIPKKSPVQDLAGGQYNVHSTHIASSFEVKEFIASVQSQRSPLPAAVQFFNSKDSIPFFFKIRERFWFDDLKARSFYQGIQESIVIRTPEGFRKPENYAIFSLSPRFLVDSVRSACQEVLGRGFIYPYRPINEAMVQELHRNMAEFLKENGLNQPSFENALVSVQSGHSGNTGVTVLKKPVIYYTSVVGEDGEEQLLPRIVFPPEMIEQSRGERGGKVLANILCIIPAGLSPQQAIEHFQSQPKIQRELIQFFAQNSEADRFLTERASCQTVENPEESCKALVSQGDVVLRGEVEVGELGVIASGNLTSHAEIRAKKALLASLFSNVTLESLSEKIYTGNNESFFERVSSPAKIKVDEILAIAAGRDVRFIGAETESKLGTHIEALANILDAPLSLVRQEVYHHLGRKKEGTEMTRETVQVVSSHRSEGPLSLHTGQNILAYGTQYKSDQALSFEAGSRINLDEVHNQREHSIQLRGRSGGVLGGSWSKQGQSVATTSVGPVVDAPEAEFHAGSGGVSLTNPTLTGHASVHTPDGKFRLNHGTQEFSSSMASSRSNVAWQSASQSSERHLTHVAPRISGTIDVYSRETIVQVANEERDSILDQIKQHGGTLTLEQVQDIHFSTYQKIQGPTPALTAVIAIGVGIATGGSGTLLGLAEGGLAETMVSAAVCSLSSQGTINLLSDRPFCSKDSLKNAFVASLTAGLTSGVGSQLGVPARPQTFLQHAERAFFRSTVDACVNVATGDEKLEDALKGAVVRGAAGACSGFAASEIGKAYSHEDMGYLSHKLLHLGTGGFLGAATALANHQDIFKGLTSGAISAVAAETIAEALAGGPNNVWKRVNARAQANGLRLNEQTFREAFQDEMMANADLARLGAALTALLARQDVNVGAAAANNALDNNFLIFVYYGAVAVGIAWSAYDFIDTLENEGLGVALRKLGIDIAVGAAGGAVLRLGGKVAIYIYKGRQFRTLREAVTAALDDRPGLKLLLTDAVEKVVALGEKFEATALGKGITEIEKKITRVKIMLSGREVEKISLGKMIREFSKDAVLDEVSKEVEDVLSGKPTEMNIDEARAQEFKEKAVEFGLIVEYI